MSMMWSAPQFESCVDRELSDGVEVRIEGPLAMLLDSPLAGAIGMVESGYR